MAKSHSERSSSSSSSSSKRDREHKRKRSKDGGVSSADESVASTSSSSTKKKHRKHRISTAASSDGESSGAESSSSAGSSSSSSKKKKSSSKKHSSSQPRPSSSLVSAPLASAFEVQYPILTLSIPPIHAHQPLVAVGELLDSLVMRFVPALNGVLVSHGQSYFLVEEGNERSKSKSSALIDGDGAFATVRTAVECCVWRPRVGMKLRGAISLEAPSHVSVLVHATFNASIPSSHMGSEWHFVHRSQDEGEEEEDGVGAAGFWEHKATKKRLGPHVDFVVIGLTILANAGGGHTLALCGSLLDRPFSLPPPSTAQQGFGSAAIGSGSTAARATRMGFGDFAAGEGGGEGATIKKGAIAVATRRVRWEGEESSDDDDETGAGDAASSKPATIKKAKGSHVKF